MYSATVLDHFHNARNVGALEAPDAVGVAGEPGHGNYLILDLQLSGDRITACGFQTFGCAPAIAAGSLLTELIKGRTVAEALALTPAQLEEALGGLPLGRRHCAALAIEALHDGLRLVEEAG
jgi:nitrogen fixation protein NifU and related proteins